MVPSTNDTASASARPSTAGTTLLRSAVIAAAMVALFAGLFGCSSTKSTSSAVRFGAVPVPEDGKRLVGVWAIDIEKTIELTKTSGDDEWRLTELRDLLLKTSTQLSLYSDGVFIQKNERQDAGGMITVEGTWTWEDGVVLLVGHLENGAGPPEPKHVRYRLEGNHLIRFDDTAAPPDPGVVHAVLRKAIGA